MARSPDGCFIGSGSDDRAVRVGRADTCEEVAVVGARQDKVSSVAWSRDSNLLLTASLDGIARIWSATPDYDRLEAHVRGRVLLILDEDERRREAMRFTDGGDG